MASPKQPEVVKQEVTQTNLPKYAEPYVTDVMQRAQGLVGQEYQPYSGQRVAGLTPEQQAVNQNILAQQTPGAITGAQQIAATAGLGALMTPGYTAGTFSSQNAGAGSASAGKAGYVDGINSQLTQQYMSPYIQNVIDAEKREALLNAKKTQLAGDLGAARQGTYGGTRQLLANMERERALGQLLGDIQTKGLQSAFDRAYAQFNTEQGLKQGVNLANLDANTRAQIANAQYATQVAIANQQANLEAQKLAEQSRQFGASQGLAGLQLAKESAQTLGNLGQVEANSGLAILNQQQQAAAQEQQVQQQILSQQYQDYLKQQALPWEELQMYSNITRGNTVAPGQTSTVYGQAPSTLSQVAGAGLGALSTAKLLGV